MEKCGCKECIKIKGEKGIKMYKHIAENCPCRCCLVKVICIFACEDMIDYCKAYAKETNYVTNKTYR